jgi:hypothetical protein
MKAAIARYHTLDHFPGVYVNILYRAEFPTSPNWTIKAGEWAGYGLKLCELKLVCERMTWYLDGGDSA